MPLIFVSLISWLQWHIKPLVGQITDETAATIKKKKKKVIEPTVTKREYTSELILVIKAKA